MSKLILGFVGILGVFTAQATTPEGKQLQCIAGNSPIPVTGFRPPSDGRIEMKVQNSSGGTVCYFCARSAGATVADRVSFGVFSDSSQWHFHYNKANHQIADSSVKTDRPLIISASAKSGIVVNGVQVPNSTFDEADFQPGGDLVLLAAQEATSGNGYANCLDYLFYWAKVYDGENILIASFVPWLSRTEKGTDIPGVLDEMTGNFYPVADSQGVRWSEKLGHRLTWCATKDKTVTIDTGFVPSSRGRIEMKLALTPSVWPDGSAYQPFAARTGESDVTKRRGFGIGIRENSLDFHYNGVIHSLDVSDIFLYRELTMSVSAKDGIFVNGRFVKNSAVGVEDFIVGSSLTIFSANGINYSNMRFYWLKVYDEADNLVASYVPWIDDFGVVAVCNELTGECIEPTTASGHTGGLYAGRTVSAEMTGMRTANVKVSAIPEGVRRLSSDLFLWPVCDAEDKGESLAAWTYKGDPVRITGDACEVEVEFPKQYKGVNRFGRVLLAAGESLTASGVQHVELNRQLTDADGVEIVFSSDDVKQQSMIFGSRTAAGSQNISILLNNGDAVVDFCNDGNYSAYRQNATLMSADAYQVVVDKFRRATTNLTAVTQVLTPNTKEYKGTAFAQPGNCRIFGASAGAPSGYGKFKGSIYSFRVYEAATGKTLYNLVPGKNANGVPCFVDTLTGDFYENKGEGHFILDAESSVSTSFVMPPLKRQGLVIFFGSALLH